MSQSSRHLVTDGRLIALAIVALLTLNTVLATAPANTGTTTISSGGISGDAANFNAVNVNGAVSSKDDVYIHKALSTTGSTAPDIALLHSRLDYTASDALSGSDLANLGIYSQTIYGAGATNPVGTVQGITSTVDVQSSGNASNEQAAYMGWVRQASGVQSRVWFADFSAHGPIGTQPRLLTGTTMLVNNYYNGTATDAPISGINIITKPASGGGAEDGHSTNTTYPNDIGLLIAGTSGGNGSPTGVGWNNAIQIGGYGSGWMGPGQGSIINTGLLVQDVQSIGVDCDNPRTATTPTCLYVGPGNKWNYFADFNAAQLPLSGTGIRMKGALDANGYTIKGIGDGTGNSIVTLSATSSKNAYGQNQQAVLSLASPNITNASQTTIPVWQRFTPKYWDGTQNQGAAHLDLRDSITTSGTQTFQFAFNDSTPVFNITADGTTSIWGKTTTNGVSLNGYTITNLGDGTGTGNGIASLSATASQNGNGENQQSVILHKPTGSASATQTTIPTWYRFNPKYWNGASSVSTKHLDIQDAITTGGVQTYQLVFNDLAPAWSVSDVGNAALSGKLNINGATTTGDQVNVLGASGTGAAGIGVYETASDVNPKVRLARDGIWFGAGGDFGVDAQISRLGPGSLQLPATTFAGTVNANSNSITSASMIGFSSTGLPTCDSTTKGNMRYTAGANGVADLVKMCLKSATDTYSWVTIATG